MENISQNNKNFYKFYLFPVLNNGIDAVNTAQMKENEQGVCSFFLS